jgi:hypothetical protein
MMNQRVKKPRRQMRYMRRMAAICPKCREEFAFTAHRVRRHDLWCIAVGPKDCGKTHIYDHGPNGYEAKRTPLFCNAWSTLAARPSVSGGLLSIKIDRRTL